MRNLYKLIMLVPLFLTAVPAHSDDELQGALTRCAAMSDDSQRLACYDEIGGRNESPALVADMTDAPAAIPADDFGAEKLADKKAEKEQPKSVSARVVRCVKDVRNKYHFYLEGGQVWKQVSDKRLNYKECDFNVTISRDFFGYKMQVEGEKSRTRVSRTR